MVELMLGHSSFCSFKKPASFIGKDYSISGCKPRVRISLSKSLHVDDSSDIDL